jgi:hypothetical protein
VNYLLKQSVDLSFLDRIPQLTTWLGFRMERNPFIIPVTLAQERAAAQMEAYRKAAMDGSLAMRSTSGSLGVEMSGTASTDTLVGALAADVTSSFLMPTAEPGFTPIGGRNVDGFAASGTGKHSAAATGPKGNKHPYESPVVPGFPLPSPVKPKTLSASTTAAPTKGAGIRPCCLGWCSLAWMCRMEFLLWC